LKYLESRGQGLKSQLFNDILLCFFAQIAQNWRLPKGFFTRLLGEKR